MAKKVFKNNTKIRFLLQSKSDILTTAKNKPRQQSERKEYKYNGLQEGTLKGINKSDSWLLKKKKMDTRTL